MWCYNNTRNISQIFHTISNIGPQHAYRNDVSFICNERKFRWNCMHACIPNNGMKHQQSVRHTNIVIFPIISQLRNPIKIIDIYGSNINQRIEYITGWNVPTEIINQRAIFSLHTSKIKYIVKYSWPKVCKKPTQLFPSKANKSYYYCVHWIAG